MIIIEEVLATRPASIFFVIKCTRKSSISFCSERLFEVNQSSSRCCRPALQENQPAASSSAVRLLAGNTLPCAPRCCCRLLLLLILLTLLLILLTVKQQGERGGGETVRINPKNGDKKNVRFHLIQIYIHIMVWYRFQGMN